MPTGWCDGPCDSCERVTATTRFAGPSAAAETATPDLRKCVCCSRRVTKEDEYHGRIVICYIVRVGRSCNRTRRLRTRDRC